MTNNKIIHCSPQVSTISNEKRIVLIKIGRQVYQVIYYSLNVQSSKLRLHNNKYNNNIILLCTNLYEHNHVISQSKYLQLQMLLFHNILSSTIQLFQTSFYKQILF